MRLLERVERGRDGINGGHGVPRVLGEHAVDVVRRELLPGAFGALGRELRRRRTVAKIANRALGPVALDLESFGEFVVAGGERVDARLL